MLTIAIPTKDRYSKLRNLLKSLEKQSTNKFFILIIDASEKFINLKVEFPNLNLTQIKFDKPNLPLQRFEAIKLAKTKFLGFFDDDVTISYDYINTVFKYLQNSPANIAGCSGWIENVPLKKTSLLSKLRRIISGINIYKQGKISKGGFAIPLLNKPKKNVDISYMMGPSMFYKTKILKTYGDLKWLHDMYDKKIGRGEDIALSGYISKHGYKYKLLNSITCFHHHLDGGSPFSKKGYFKGIADSYSRNQISKQIVRKLNFQRKLSLAWYMFFTFLFFNKQIWIDYDYLKGFFSGLKKNIN